MMRSTNIQKMNSQLEGKQRATLANQFNDDFEPVRPVMLEGNEDTYQHDGYYDEVDRSNQSNKQIKTTPSHSKMAYDQISGQKVFRVTTTNKRGPQNIMNRQQQRESAIIARGPLKKTKAPLPNAGSTDRSRISKATVKTHSKVRQTNTMDKTAFAGQFGSSQVYQSEARKNN